MKKLILLFLLLSVNCFAQEYYFENGIEYVKMRASDWEATRDKAIKYYFLYKDSDSINTLYERAVISLLEVHKLDSVRMLRKDSIQSILQSEIVDYDNQLRNCLNFNQNKRVVLFEYEGTYCGLTASYLFQDSIIKQQTFLGALNYGFKIETGLKIEKWTFRPSLFIPFKTPMSISLFVGYRIF